MASSQKPRRPRPTRRVVSWFSNRGCPFSGGGFPPLGEESSIMSSSHVTLSSGHSDSQNYATDTPTNQELVDELRTAYPAEVALQEGVTSACEAIRATKVGLTKKKKKKMTLVKGAK
ncbi:hypothetical protein LIER_25618 [Lithospermum erythrorhizon]|uniref:Uncharacterized protein n=1 Tax=Lithospermum erythrorhizon TaxID=34254 RepID=A0AAV3R9G7_LITER